MIDKDKVILMSKMAIYEKKLGQEDKKINEYYQDDYVYINNFKTRLYVTVAYILIVSWSLFYQFYTKKLNIETFDIKGLSYKLLLYYFLVLFLFSVISSIIYSKKYKIAQKRLDRYINEIKQLETMEE